MTFKKNRQGISGQIIIDKIECAFPITTEFHNLIHHQPQSGDFH